MMRTSLFVACTWIAIVWLACSVSRGETRIGVIASETPDTAALMPLVELALSQYPGVVLVERNAIKEVLREQQLQALLAADAPGKRAALGKMLKADLLVFLAGRDDPKPHVAVVVCETQQGLRLCAERVLSAGKPETDSKAVMKQIVTAARKRQEKIADIVAVPLLVNNSLSHEEDNLQGAFAQFVERALLRRPGVLVVELAEAKALVQEMVVSGTTGVERRLPLYLLGEYRFEGTGEKRRAQFTWRLRRGEKELDRRHEEDLKVEKMPERLRRAAVDMVDKALGKNSSPSDPQVEARQLADRARAFLDLGLWNEALATAEASLFLTPDQPAVHADAVRALNAMAAAEWESFTGGVANEKTHRALAYMRAALPHLEAFMRGTEMSYDKHHWCLNMRPWLNFYYNVVSPVERERHRVLTELYREVMLVAERVLAAKSAAKVQDHSLYFLVGFTELPSAPEYGADQTAWLKKELPTMCQKRLRLLEGFTWLKVRPSGFDRLILLNSRDLSVLSSPAYLEFLERVEKLPNAEMREWAQRPRKQIAWLHRRPTEARPKEPPHKTTTTDDAGQQSGAEVRYTKFTLSRPDREGKPQLFRRPIAQWFPVGTETDVIVSAPEPYLKHAQQTGDPERDLGMLEGEVFLVREKGQIRRLRLERDPVVKYSAQGTATIACYDGRYVWVAVASEDSPLLMVFDFQRPHWWRFMPEDGVPPFSNIRMSALAPGKVLLAGHFGRSWCAIASFDPAAGKSVKVFHEARRALAPDPDRSKPPDVDVACGVHEVFSLTGGPDPRMARAVVFRSLSNGALLIDPEKPSVTGAIQSGVALFPFVHGGALYYKSYTDRTGHRTNPLYCVAPPDFVPKEASPDVPPGDTFFHQGRFYVWENAKCLWYWATKPEGPYHGLQGRAPIEPRRSQAALSALYGFVVFNQENFYRAELPDLNAEEAIVAPKRRQGVQP